MPSKEEYWKNPDKYRKATITYNNKNPERKKDYDRAWMAAAREANPEKYRSYGLAYRSKNPERYLIQHAKHRAKKNGLMFDLEEGDLHLPEFCPVLGIKLEWGVGKRASANHNSPSLDRIVPERGYTKGNVMVISNRANHLRNNATAEELRLVADYAKRLEMFG
jgi:hypothetical protein